MPLNMCNFETETEEMEAACQAIGRKLDDIKVVENPPIAPSSMRFLATWGDYDLDCKTGTGPTPQAAMWELIDRNEAMIDDATARQTNINLVQQYCVDIGRRAPLLSDGMLDKVFSALLDASISLHPKKLGNQGTTP